MSPMRLEPPSFTFLCRTETPEAVRFDADEIKVLAETVLFILKPLRLFHTQEEPLNVPALIY